MYLEFVEKKLMDYLMGLLLLIFFILVWMKIGFLFICVIYFEYLILCLEVFEIIMI